MPSPRIAAENENTMHFLTITVIEWIDIFTKPEYFKLICDSLTFCRKNKGLLLYDFIIMTNHIHLIVKAKKDTKLSSIIRDFKRHTTTEIFKQLEKDNRIYILNLLKNSFSRKKETEKQIWQRENHAISINSEKFYFEKAKYIVNNPVRKKYVAKAEDWIYSSAEKRLFNKKAVIELDDPFAADCK